MESHPSNLKTPQNLYFVVDCWLTGPRKLQAYTAHLHSVAYRAKVQLAQSVLIWKNFYNRRNFRIFLVIYPTTFAEILDDLFSR